MDLKHYQRRIVDEVERYLRAVEKQRDAGNKQFASLAAWRELGLGRYENRENGIGEDLPTFCIKVPTGGGKTLLATYILGSIYRTILKDRNGAGLVLWMVPSSQIYRDTLRALRNREHMYRRMLEHAVSRRIEVWEKGEIIRLTPVRLRECLNILVVQLASTNRQTKEDLKFFRDSGGNIVQHFPPENDPQAHRELKERIPNLDMIANDDQRREYLIATSIGNLVKLCKPPVILDEGHKASTAQARKTIEDFNASVVVELTATPKEVKAKQGEWRPNIVARASGEELQKEHMIKLPLNIATSGQKNWKDVLTQARDKRDALAAKAAEYESVAGPDRHIRPIVLVQVVYTGKKQTAKEIHADRIKDHLIQRLSIPAEAVRIKSAESDELDDIENLMDEGCPVQWIITRSALQEGWDCPFAYILVSLSNVGSKLGLTQIVGRVLRQPYQQRTPFAELNESYIYCLHHRAGEIARQVKQALENEGYEGEREGLVVDSSRGTTERKDRIVPMRPQFAIFYRPFEGKVYLPRFCVKQNGRFEPLDYFRHLIARVDVDRFDYRFDWPLAEAMTDAKDRFLRYHLGTGLEMQYETEVDLQEADEAVVAWLVANLRFDFLSHKQLRRIVNRIYHRLCTCELSSMVKGRLGTVKFPVRNRIESFVQEQVDHQTKAAFDDLFDAGSIGFFLECKECRFELPPSIKIESTGALTPLTHPDTGEFVEKSLFEFAPAEAHNSLEKAVALCLDRDANVLWWYRNKVGPENFVVRAYQKNGVYPDFVVQSGSGGKPRARVIVVESKGKHLAGSRDTEYKRDVARYFERVGKKVPWQRLAEDFKDHVFRFQILDESQPDGHDWQDELRAILAAQD